jgi:transcriptional regulator with XRE-family HTH domain
LNDYLFSDNLSKMINERLKEIRKSLNLNQSEFASKIGLAQSGYSQIETGENSLTEQNIKLVCFVYNVNETWLRSGEGEMFNNKIKLKDEDEKMLLDMFRYLSPEMQEFVLKKIKECIRLDSSFGN